MNYKNYVIYIIITIFLKKIKSFTKYVLKKYNFIFNYIHLQLRPI